MIKLKEGEWVVSGWGSGPMYAMTNLGNLWYRFSGDSHWRLY